MSNYSSTLRYSRGINQMWSSFSKELSPATVLVQADVDRRTKEHNGMEQKVAKAICSHDKNDNDSATPPSIPTTNNANTS